MNKKQRKYLILTIVFGFISIIAGQELSESKAISDWAYMSVSICFMIYTAIMFYITE